MGVRITRLASEIMYGLLVVTLTYMVLAGIAVPTLAGTTGGTEFNVVSVWMPTTMYGSVGVYALPFNMSAPGVATVNNFYVVDQQGHPYYSYLFSTNPPLAVWADGSTASKTYTLFYGGGNPYGEYTATPGGSVPLFPAYDDFDYDSGLWIYNGSHAIVDSLDYLNGVMMLNKTYSPGVLCLWLVRFGKTGSMIQLYSRTTYKGWALLRLTPTNFGGWNDIIDGNDIYFLDKNGEPLYYDIVYFNKTAKRADILVDVELDPGINTIYMLYGGQNPYTGYRVEPVGPTPVIDITPPTTPYTANTITRIKTTQQSTTVLNTTAYIGPGTIIAPHLYTLYFDGVDDYVKILASQSLKISGPLSIEIFIKRVSSGAMTFVQLPGGYHLWIQANNEIRFADDYGHGVDSIPVDIINKYSHIVAMFSGKYGDNVSLNNCKIYLNTQEIQNEIIGTPWSPTLTGTYLWIGIHNQLDLQFNGYIGFVRIYNRALSGSEINASYVDHVVNATGLVLFLDPTFYNGTHYIDLLNSSLVGTPYGVSRAPAEEKWLWVVEDARSDNYVHLDWFPVGTIIKFINTTSGDLVAVVRVYGATTGTGQVPDTYLHLPPSNYTVEAFIPASSGVSRGVLGGVPVGVTGTPSNNTCYLLSNGQVLYIEYVGDGETLAWVAGRGYPVEGYIVAPDPRGTTAVFRVMDAMRNTAKPVYPVMVHPLVFTTNIVLDGSLASITPAKDLSGIHVSYWTYNVTQYTNNTIWIHGLPLQASVTVRDSNGVPVAVIPVPPTLNGTIVYLGPGNYTVTITVPPPGYMVEAQVRNAVIAGGALLLPHLYRWVLDDDRRVWRPAYIDTETTANITTNTIIAPHLYNWKLNGVDGYIVYGNAYYSDAIYGIAYANILSLPTYEVNGGTATITGFTGNWSTGIMIANKWWGKGFATYVGGHDIDRYLSLTELGSWHMYGYYTVAQPGNGWAYFTLDLYIDGLLKLEGTLNITTSYTVFGKGNILIGRGYGLRFLDGYVAYCIYANTNYTSNYNNIVTHILNGSGVKSVLDPTFFNGTNYIDLLNSSVVGTPYGGVSRVLADHIWLWVVENTTYTGVILTWFPLYSIVDFYNATNGELVRSVVIDNRTSLTSSGQVAYQRISLPPGEYRIEAHIAYGLENGTWDKISVTDITPILIKNNINVTVYNYTAKIILNINNFNKWNEIINGSDIYFLDQNGDPLYFYIEKLDLVDKEAVIWVNITLPANSSTIIYMCYGSLPNPYSSYNNPFHTFLFYDDFETWSGWVQYGSGVVSQASSPVYHGSYSLKKDSYGDPNGGYKNIGFPVTITSSVGLVMDVWINRTYLSGANLDRLGFIDSSGNGEGFYYDHGTGDYGVDFRSSYSPTQYQLGTTGLALTNTWYHVIYETFTTEKKITITAGSSTWTASKSLTSTYTTFTRVYVFGGYTYYVDWLKVYYVLSTPPTITIEDNINVLANITYRVVSPIYYYYHYTLVFSLLVNGTVVFEYPVSSGAPITVLVNGTTPTYTYGKAGTVYQVNVTLTTGTYNLTVVSRAWRGDVSGEYLNYLGPPIYFRDNMTCVTDYVFLHASSGAWDLVYVPGVAGSLQYVHHLSRTFNVGINNGTITAHLNPPAGLMVYGSRYVLSTGMYMNATTGTWWLYGVLRNTTYTYSYAKDSGETGEPSVNGTTGIHVERPDSPHHLYLSYVEIYADGEPVFLADPSFYNGTGYVDPLSGYYAVSPSDPDSPQYMPRAPDNPWIWVFRNPYGDGKVHLRFFPPGTLVVFSQNGEVVAKTWITGNATWPYTVNDTTLSLPDGTYNITAYMPVYPSSPEYNVSLVPVTIPSPTGTGLRVTVQENISYPGPYLYGWINTTPITLPPTTPVVVDARVSGAEWCIGIVPESNYTWPLVLAYSNGTAVTLMYNNTWVSAGLPAVATPYTYVSIEIYPNGTLALSIGNATYPYLYRDAEQVLVVNATGTLYFGSTYYLFLGTYMDAEPTMDYLRMYNVTTGVVDAENVSVTPVHEYVADWEVPIGNWSFMVPLNTTGAQVLLPGSTNITITYGLGEPAVGDTYTYTGDNTVRVYVNDTLRSSFTVSPSLDSWIVVMYNGTDVLVGLLDSGGLYTLETTIPVPNTTRVLGPPTVVSVTPLPTPYGSTKAVTGNATLGLGMLYSTAQTIVPVSPGGTAQYRLGYYTVVDNTTYEYGVSINGTVVDLYLAVNGTVEKVLGMGLAKTPMILGVGYGYDNNTDSLIVYGFKVWEDSTSGATLWRHTFFAVPAPTIPGAQPFAESINGTLIIDRFGLIIGSTMEKLVMGDIRAEIGGPYPVGGMVKYVTITRPITVQLSGGQILVYPSTDTRHTILLRGFKGWTLDLALYGTSVTDTLITSDEYGLDFPPGFSAVIVADISARKISIVSAQSPSVAGGKTGVVGEKAGTIHVVASPPPPVAVPSLPSMINMTVLVAGIIGASILGSRLTGNIYDGVTIAGLAATVLFVALGMYSYAGIAVMIAIASQAFKKAMQS